MHEMYLMQGVLDAVRESASQRKIVKITEIKLVVGKFSMALPDSLQFAFEILSSGEDLLKGASLIIEEKEIVCECKHCHSQFGVDTGYRFVCPHCGNRQAEVVSGRELYIDYYEGEEANGTDKDGQ